MSINETRNCNCNNTDNVNETGNYMTNNVNASNNYMSNNVNTTSNYTNNCDLNDNENMMPDCDLKNEMLHQIMCYEFSINELALYLDTHPDDKKAICLHNRYCRELKDLKDKYQKMFGPLTIKYPCNKWRWIEEPWPWERGSY